MEEERGWREGSKRREETMNHQTKKQSSEFSKRVHLKSPKGCTCFVCVCEVESDLEVGQRDRLGAQRLGILVGLRPLDGLVGGKLVEGQAGGEKQPSHVKNPRRVVFLILESACLRGGSLENKSKHLFV